MLLTFRLLHGGQGSWLALGHILPADQCIEAAIVAQVFSPDQREETSGWEWSVRWRR